MIQSIITGLIVAGTLAVAGWSLRRWGRRVLVAAMSAVRESAGEIRRARLTCARASKQELDIRIAADAGEGIVTSATGSNPARVTVEGAVSSVGFNYTDLRRYKQEVASGRVPHLRAFCCGRPPRVGQRLTVPTEGT